MNDKRLRIYLDDHLALMIADVELIGRCWRNNRGTPLGKFLQQLENEVKAQKSIARELIHRVVGKEASKAKQNSIDLAESYVAFVDELLAQFCLEKCTIGQRCEDAAHGLTAKFEDAPQIAANE